MEENKREINQHTGDEVVFSLEKINKSFSSVRVLKDMELRLHKNKGMCIVGENGAGKSTLMKIMTGIYSKDSGKMYYQGHLVDFKDMHDSREKGIAIIHQEQNLALALTVAQNVFLGRELLTKFGTLDTRRMNIESKKYLDKLAANFSPTTIVGNLTVAQRQLVEIAKSLSQNPKIIIFDEPTSVLTNQETEKLYEIVENLKVDGVSLAWITHRMEEIEKVCEYSSIIRDGEFIEEKIVKDTTSDELVKLMIGRELTNRYPIKTPVKKQKPQLVVNEINSDKLNNIKFSLQPGEITFFYGLVGAGRTELALTLVGDLPYTVADINLFGEKYKPSSPKHAFMKKKIFYLSEDRKHYGLHVNKSISFNSTLSSLKKTLFPFTNMINDNKINKFTDDYIDKLSIRTRGRSQLVSDLSGGNQQKVSFAKGMISDPKLFIIDEPTRGVDVGARKDIYDILYKLKEDSETVLMLISSDMPEVIGLADRVIVMNNGKITGDLRGNDINQETILKYALDLVEK